jgi:hypothetical protein
MKSSVSFVFEYGTVYIFSTHKNFLAQMALLYTVMLVCHLYGDQACPLCERGELKWNNLLSRGRITN